MEGSPKEVPPHFQRASARRYPDGRHECMAPHALIMGRICRREGRQVREALRKLGEKKMCCFLFKCHCFYFKIEVESISHY